jgi:hypothetical protein
VKRERDGDAVCYRWVKETDRLAGPSWVSVGVLVSRTQKVRVCVSRGT